MVEKKPDRLTLAAFSVLVILGGLNAIAVRYSNQELPPLWGATLRLGSAALVLSVVALVRRYPLPRGQSLLGTVWYGVLGFGITYALIYWGLQTVSPGLGQVLLALVPLLTFFFAVAHGQERFYPRRLLGGLLALAGILIVFGDQLSANTPLLPMLALVGAAAGFAETGVIIKKYPKGHPVTMNALAMAIGALILFVLSMAWQETPAVPTQPATWAAVLYLSLLGSCLVFMLVLFTIRRWTASASAFQFVLMPIVTLAVSSRLTGERITPLLLIGGALVAVGVYFGALSRPRQKAPGQREPALQSDPSPALEEAQKPGPAD